MTSGPAVLSALERGELGPRSCGPGPASFPATPLATPDPDVLERVPCTVGANRHGAFRIDGCIVGRMPKMQVYLPDELYEKVKSQTARLNVSGILQDALAQRLDQLERQDALAAAVDSYTAEFGVFSDEELNRQAEADRKQTVRPGTKRKSSSAA